MSQASIVRFKYLIFHTTLGRKFVPIGNANYHSWLYIERVSSLKIKDKNIC